MAGTFSSERPEPTRLAADRTGRLLPSGQTTEVTGRALKETDAYGSHSAGRSDRSPRVLE